MTATTDTGELPTVSPAAPEIPDQPIAETIATSSASAGDATVAAPSVVDRLRSLSTRRLTAPGGIVVALLVLTPGVGLDLALDGTFGVASSVTFVAAGVVAALSVHVRALATAVVLPPLLFVTAVTVLARFSGNNRGSRELVLDVGTTLAISAPVLFAGTLATYAVVLGRALNGLVRR